MGDAGEKRSVHGLGGDGERRVTFQTTQGTVFFKCRPRDVHQRAYLCIFHDKRRRQKANFLEKIRWSE